MKLSTWNLSEMANCTLNAARRRLQRPNASVNEAIDMTNRIMAKDPLLSLSLYELAAVDVLKALDDGDFIQISG